MSLKRYYTNLNKIPQKLLFREFKMLVVWLLICYFDSVQSLFFASSELTTFKPTPTLSGTI